MKLQLLASVAVVLLSAVPGVFSEEPSAAVAKPIESFAGVFAAVSDETADLIGEDESDQEQGRMVAGKSSKRSRRRRSRRRRSRRRRSRRRSSRRRRSRRRSSRVTCGRRMRSSDRRTCRRLEREFCDSSRDRRRNRSMCRAWGFRTLAEGAAEDAPETFAADSEVFSEDTLREADMIVEDLEAVLEDEDASESASSYEDFDDSGDYDPEDEDEDEYGSDPSSDYSEDYDSEDYDDEDLEAYKAGYEAGLQAGSSVSEDFYPEMYDAEDELYWDRRRNSWRRRTRYRRNRYRRDRYRRNRYRRNRWDRRRRGCRGRRWCDESGDESKTQDVPDEAEPKPSADEKPKTPANDTPKPSADDKPGVSTM